MTPEQLDSHQKKMASSKPIAAPRGGLQRWQALGRLPKGQMNKTEQAFAEELERLKQAGEIIDWKFHPMNIRLATNTFYEVDFLALGADMSLTIYETKGGYTSDKGQLKIKLVAEVMPWFRMVKAVKQSKKDGGGFKLEEFNA